MPVAARRAAAALALATAAGLTLAGCGQTAAVAPTRATVGELLPPGSGSPSCTASVVQSPRGDVVLTAAHCLAGSARGVTFVPGWSHGLRPYGTWTVTDAYVDAGWRATQDPLRDYAFLTLAPSGGRSVQSVVGAERVGPSPSSGSRVEPVAYMAGGQVGCTTAVYRNGAFPAFDCDGYAGGTSGSPWLVAPVGSPPTVVGIIAGLHQGGCTSATSYSSLFDVRTAYALARASDGVPADVLPAPHGDGC